MTNCTRVALWLLTPLLLAVELCGAADANSTVRCDLQIVRVPQSAGLHLRPRLRDATTIARGTTELHEMIADGKATLVAFTTMSIRSGTRTVSETVEEMRYRTEWNPPIHPWFGGNGGEANMPNIEFEAETAMAQSSNIDVPSFFETRNVGLTLELEATTNTDGRMIDAAFVVTRVRYLGERRVSVVDRSDRRYDQPNFRTSTLTGSQWFQSGKWRLVAAEPDNAEPAGMEFTLMRLTTVSSTP